MAVRICLAGYPTNYEITCATTAALDTGAGPVHGKWDDRSQWGFDSLARVHCSTMIALTPQPTRLPEGMFWQWCEKCDANNPECGRCGGLGYYSLLWRIPIWPPGKHGVINSNVC